MNRQTDDWRQAVVRKEDRRLRRSGVRRDRKAGDRQGRQRVINLRILESALVKIQSGVCGNEEIK